MFLILMHYFTAESQTIMPAPSATKNRQIRLLNTSFVVFFKTATFRNEKSTSIMTLALFRIYVFSYCKNGFLIRNSYTVLMILQFKSLLCQTPLYEFLDDYITFTTCNGLILTTIIGNRMTKTPSNQKII